MMKHVSVDSPRDPDKYYGPPCIPGVRNVMWECDTKEEYVQMRIAFEEAEANCNTCKHLVRQVGFKPESGWLEATCGLDGHAVRFHPNDPMHMPCHVNRR